MSVIASIKALGTWRIELGRSPPAALHSAGFVEAEGAAPGGGVARKRTRGTADGRAPRLSGIRVSVRPARYPTSSRIAFRTLVGTAAYFSGSIAAAARPVDIERSSVV